MPKKAEGAHIRPMSFELKTTLTEEPAQERVPSDTPCQTARNIFNREEHDKGGLDAEPDARARRMERRDRLEDGDERREQDERGGGDVDEEGRRGGVRVLEQSVQRALPWLSNGGEREWVRGGGDGGGAPGKESLKLHVELAIIVGVGVLVGVGRRREISVGSPCGGMR